MKNIKYYLSVLVLIIISNSAKAQITLTFQTDTNYVCNGNGCNYNGPKILINEVMLCPSVGDGSIYDQDNTRRGEWIELYNPDLCKPVDISCYYLGNNAPDIDNYGGGYRIPDNTIVPPSGFVVIRGTNATPVPASLLVQNGGTTLEFIVDDLPGNVCLETGANRLWFPNAGGWFAFYDKNGNPQDAISWNSTTNSCLSCAPCVATCAGCTNATALPSYDAIPAGMKTYITNLNPATYMGQSWRRIPDGGAWNSSASAPTVGNCNSICNPPPVITCNGQAVVVPTGGTPPYTYTWNDTQASLTDTAFGLCEGYYTVTVTDANNLQTIDSVYIPNYVPIVSINNIAPVCVGANSFSLTTYGSPVGGVYSGDGVTGTTFNPMTAGVGVHQINNVYADTNTCMSSDSTTVTVNPLPTSTFTASSPLCNLANSIINYTGDGLSTATYTWDFDGGTATPISGLQNYSVHWPAAGVYYITLTVTQTSCTSIITIDTVAISDLSIDASIISNISCHGMNDGSGTVVPSNGLLPYTYQWNTSPVQNTQNISNLPAGTYTVTVTDSINCSATDNIVITEPAPLVTSLSSLHNSTCYNANNGNAAVTAIGGTTPYTYTWSGGTPSGNSVSGLGIGNYTVTVSDNHGCDTIISFSISQPPQLVLSLSGINETCLGSCNGSITADVSGGTLPYQYHWSNSGSLTNILANICAGNYSVTVTDSNNCSITDQTSISTNTIITAFASVDSVNSAVNQPVYFYSSNANSYIWNFGDGSPTTTVQDPNHIYTTAGTYTVTLTVSSGPPDSCEDVVTIVITIFIPSHVFIPNIITPNGDGSNDEFRVKSVGLGSEEMLIYNRWGKKVFSWDKVGGSWDGTDGNRTYADATYFYIYTAKGAGDGKTYDMHGTVTVLK